LTEAETELLQTLKLAEQLGNPTQIWKTHQALGKLFYNQGKINQAVEQYGSALKIVETISEDLTDSKLKEGFLKSETIKEVIAQAEGN